MKWKLMCWDINAFEWFLDEYETPKHKFVIYTCRLHIHDMFDEIPVMASRGPAKVLFK